MGTKVDASSLAIFDEIAKQAVRQPKSPIKVDSSKMPRLLITENLVELLESLLGSDLERSTRALLHCHLCRALWREKRLSQSLSLSRRPPTCSSSSA